MADELAEVGQVELATILDVTPRAVRGYHDEGIPHRYDGRTPRYPTAAAVRWFFERKHGVGTERSARERLLEVQVERAELELLRELRQVVRVEDVVDDYRADLTACRQGFLVLPARIAGVLPLPQSESVALIEVVVHEVMEALSLGRRLDDRVREAAAADEGDQDDEAA